MTYLVPEMCRSWVLDWVGRNIEAGALKRVLILASLKYLCSLFSVLYKSSVLSRVAFRHAFSLLVLARYLVMLLKLNTKEKKNQLRFKVILNRKRQSKDRSVIWF